jgi:fibronectin-binding autotransporter adhesin
MSGRKSVNCRRGSARIAAAVALALVAGQSARAATDNWNGGANDSLWDDGLNWSNFVKPTATDDAVFGSTGVTTVTLGSGELANSLTFNANGYTFVGGNLAITTGNVAIAAGTGAILSSVLTGSAGLNYIGNGTGLLTLAGANTYTGTTAVGSGTLRVTNVLGLGASGVGNDTTVNAGATLELAVNGTIATEPLTLNGTGVGGTAGALLVDNSLTWSGGITIATDSTINVGSTAIFTQNTTAMAVNGNLTKTGTGEFLLGNGITTGSGVLNVGAGTFTVNGGRWNSGNITVGSGATFQTLGGGTTAIGAAPSVTINPGGLLDWGDTNATADAFGALTIGGTGINGTGAWINSVNNAGQVIAPSTLTLTANTTVGGFGTVATATPFTASGFALTKIGFGAFKSTATSGLPFNDGSLTLDSGSLVLAPTGTNAVTLTGGTAAGSTFTVAQGGGVLQFAAASGTPVSYMFGDGSSSTLTRGDNATLVIRTVAADLGTIEQFVLNTSIANLPPVVSGGNSASKMLSPWLAAFNGTNGDFVTYSAPAGFAPIAYDQTNPTAPSDPTLTAQFNAATTLPNPTNAAFAIRVDNALTLPASGTLNVGDGTHPAGVILNTSAATIGPAGTTLSFGGSEGIIYGFGTGTPSITATIAGTAGVTVAGTSPVSFAGTNTYTGGTRINSGATVVINSDASLGDATNPNPITLNGGTLLYPAPASHTTLTLNANHVIVLGPAGGMVSVTQTGGDAAIVINGTNQITGSGPLYIGPFSGGTKTNGLQVNAPQNYTGGTYFVSGGLDRIQIGDPRALGTGDVHINGGEVYMTGSSTTAVANNFYIGSAGGEGRGAIRDAANYTLAGNITLFNNATISNDHSGTYTISGNISGPWTLTFNGTGSSVAASTAILTGNNSQAATVINDVVSINADAALGEPGGPVTLNTGTQAGTLRAGASNITLNPLRTISLGSGTTTGNVTIDTQANTMTISGPVVGPGTLVKAGTGTLALAGPGSYTGGTTIGAGAVLANYLDSSATPTGSLGTAAVNVNTGGTLGGGQVVRANGTAVHIASPVNVNAGAAGSGVPGGTITAGLPGPNGTTANLITQGQTWTGSAAADGTGGTYAWNLNLANAGTPGGTLNNDKSGANWSQITMTSLTVSGNFNLQVTGLNAAALGTGGSSFNPSQSYRWVAANVPTSAGTITNSGTFVLPAPVGFGTTALGVFSASIDTTSDPGFSDVVVSYASPAPEPTSLALLGASAAGLLLRRRRRAGRS